MYLVLRGLPFSRQADLESTTTKCMTASAEGARRHQSFPGPWALSPVPSI